MIVGNEVVCMRVSFFHAELTLCGQATVGIKFEIVWNVYVMCENFTCISKYFPMAIKLSSVKTYSPDRKIASSR